MNSLSIARSPFRSGVLRRLALTFLVAVSPVGCGADAAVAPNPVMPPDPVLPPPPAVLDGSWRALYWIVETASGAVFDVITEGGSIALQVNGDIVTGNMHVPETVTNGAPTTVDMAGIVRIEGDSVRFEQAEDTFVQRAVWQHLPGSAFDALVLANEAVEGARFTVVLVRNW